MKRELKGLKGQVHPFCDDTITSVEKKNYWFSMYILSCLIT